MDYTPTSKKRVFSVFVFGALADVLFGYDLGVVGVALLFIKVQMHLSPVLQGWVVSSLLIGAMIGGASSGKLADRFGRKPIILSTAIAFAIGAVGAALSPNVALLILFRFIMGLGVGASSVVVTIYLSEMSPTESRGNLTSLNQFMVILGILLAYIVDYLLSPLHAWRLMFGIALIPAIAVFIGMYFGPETPRWLIKNGFETEARKVLETITTSVDDRFKEMKNVIETEKKRHRSRIMTPKMRLAIVAAMGIAIFPQIMGVNSITYYAPSILIKVGFTTSAAIIANVGIGALELLMTIVAMKLIDHVGRKPLLLIGSIGMAITMFVNAICFHLMKSGTSHTLGILVLASIAIYIACFGVSWGTIVRVFISEILPLEFRGSGMGYVYFFNWVFNFLVGLTFPVILGSFGADIMFFIFAVICIAAFVFVALLVPETKQRSLEEIELTLNA
ncbi:sugar porter family MFS transporter [Alicyclobacillus mengziensis]|uniref:Sugar porter family MFS transporter n=1 Tax=Alicyclobacillus mengziensis TaxID=2931921 RepID=A0A9X7Z7L6_9BACL|nr:sugar porter family MFS transporter [Alicyclobacillus mengziensis]QSO47491.1 sugar porter family MFS transporter [Alicyclobacillus mengziensis]